MDIYLYTFLCALGAVLVITPLMRRLALKVNAIDQPDERKIHDRPTPYLGGMAIYLAFVVSLLLAYSLSSKVQSYQPFPALLVACLVIVVLGLYDDLRGSSAWIKFLFQSTAALIVIHAGVRIQLINVPFYHYLDLGIWTWPITCLWLVGICNAVNLIDGLDGLAAGVCLFAVLSIFATSVRWDEAEAALLCAALAGSLLGFLRYNFFPARIFMGDTGALLLGFLLGVISIMKGSKSTSAVALLIPITALGIPILDTAVAILRRLRRRQRLFVADRDHLHHRLLHIGLSHRQAVILIYMASLYLGILSFAMAFVPPSLNALIFGVLAVSGMAGGAALIFAERATARRRSAQPEPTPSARTNSGPL